MAVGAGLGVVAGEARVVEKFFAESDARGGGGVVVGQGGLRPTGGDEERQGRGRGR